MLAVALFANQYLTLRKIKALVLSRAPGDPVNTLASKLVSLVIDAWPSFIGPEDVIVGVVILLAAGYIVRQEIRWGTVTALLTEASRSDRVLFPLLALVAVVVTRSYLNPGQVFMGDAETHMLRAWMFVEHFKHLDTPVWSNAWYGGFPLLANYGPFYFVLTAVLTLACGDIHTATKVLLWACHVGSAFTMFLFLREVTRRSLPSLVGACAYTLSFHRLHIILYQGDLQLSVLFLIYPAVLLIAERFMRTQVGARRTFVTLTMLLALLIVNHHGYAFFGLILYALYALVRMAATTATAINRVKVLTLLGSAGAAALCISAFLLVPFLFAMDEHRGMNTSAFLILVPNPFGIIMLAKLFRWSAVSDGTSVGYIGVSIGLLAVAGAAFGIRRRIPSAIALVACLGTSLLMVHDHVSYNIKNIDFFMVFVSALTAWAVMAAESAAARVQALARSLERWGPQFPARVAVVCIGVLLLDLGPTTFQNVFRENYGFKQPMYERVLARDPGYTVIERQVLTYDPHRPPDAFFDRNKLGIPSAYDALQTPLGFFHEGAGLSYGYRIEIVKHLHTDLNGGRLSRLSAEGLYLLGVKNVLFRDRYQWFTPSLESSPLFQVADGSIRLQHATPLVFSTRVASIADVPGYPTTDVIRSRRYLEPETFDYSGRYFDALVKPVLETMQVDMAAGTAQTLIARDDSERADLRPASALETQVLSFTSDLKRVDVRYRSNTDAVGQLPYNYFPYLSVLVDGRPVHAFRSAFNTVLLRVPKGEHVVSLRGAMPPLQARMLWLGLIVLLLVVVAPKRLLTRFEGRPSS